MENKLELKHFCAYLPYNLNCKLLCGDGVFNSIIQLTLSGLYEYGISRLTPLLRPLSELNTEIQHFRSQAIIQHVIDYPYDYNELQYITKKEFDYLASKHYDLFGLLHRGLAVPLT